MKKIVFLIVTMITFMFTGINCYAIKSDYTGWTKSVSGKRYYYVGGKRVKGVHQIGKLLCTFDKNGACIYRRNLPSKTRPYILFDNENTVSRSSGEIEFLVDLNHVNNNEVGKREYYEFDVAHEFELYVYNGRWEKIPLKKGISDDVSLIPKEDGTCRLSMDLDMFDYNFSNGIYRVKVTLYIPNATEYKIELENGDLTTKPFYTYCEFNLVE